MVNVHIATNYSIFMHCFACFDGTMDCIGGISHGEVRIH